MKKLVLFAYCFNVLFFCVHASNDRPTIEIELKYEILDRSRLDPFLQTLQYKETHCTRDSYFDTTQGTYFKKGLWIRNRNNQSLDFKFNREGLLDQSKPMTSFCEEHSFQLPLQVDDLARLVTLCDFLELKVPATLDLQEFIVLNGIQEMALVYKTRKIYRHGQFKIMIDIVENVGDFLEIEFMAFDASNSHTITQEMESILKGLPLKQTTITYDAAWWKVHHFDIYQQGRYIRP